MDPKILRLLSILVVSLALSACDAFNRLVGPKIVCKPWAGVPDTGIIGQPFRVHSHPDSVCAKR